MRTFGSPKTPRTTGSARNPSNEYVSQSRRRRFDILAIRQLCQIFNPAKMQNIAALVSFVPLQAFEFTHSIPRRPYFHKRKNYLFAGSDSGGVRAAAMYTLIESAKMTGIDPEAYLRDVLARIADHPINRIGDLLPWKWKPAG